MVEIVRPLKIGFIGYNIKQTDIGLKCLVKNNEEQVAHFARAEIMLKDGTTIVPIYNEDNIRGRKLDQIILFDDERWNIWEERGDLIRIALSYICGYSCVPEDYVIIKYEN